ncbi:hypothetical protein PCE1_000106 [Barthelona sp. PCE]
MSDKTYEWFSAIIESQSDDLAVFEGYASESVFHVEAEFKKHDVLVSEDKVVSILCLNGDLTNTNVNIRSYLLGIFGELYNTKEIAFSDADERTVEDNGEQISVYKLPLGSLHQHHYLGLPTLEASFSSNNKYFFMFSHPRYSFLSLIRYCQNSTTVIRSSDSISWLLYQLHNVMQHLLSIGFNLPYLWIDTCFVNEMGIVYCTGFLPTLFYNHDSESVQDSDDRLLKDVFIDWHSENISNFDYLIFINELANREPNNPFRSAILPWVTDFKGGQRDLTKSKNRLHRGDLHLEALEQTTGYHIEEPISDLTWFTIMSRIATERQLKIWVRSKFSVGEYPDSFAKIYSATPDEAIPELYSDVTLLESKHEGMPDMSIPEFIRKKEGQTDGEAFIEWHSALLESDSVSDSIHHWIDLNFGRLLNDDDLGRSHLNVASQFVVQGLKWRGFERLFLLSHPSKNCNLSDKTVMEFLREYGSLNKRPNLNSLIHQSEKDKFIDIAFELMFSKPRSSQTSYRERLVLSTLESADFTESFFPKQHELAYSVVFDFMTKFNKSFCTYSAESSFVLLDSSRSALSAAIKLSPLLMLSIFVIHLKDVGVLRLFVSVLPLFQTLLPEDRILSIFANRLQHYQDSTIRENVCHYFSSTFFKHILRYFNTNNILRIIVYPLCALYHRFFEEGSDAGITQLALVLEATFTSISPSYSVHLFERIFQVMNSPTSVQLIFNVCVFFGPVVTTYSFIPTLLGLVTCDTPSKTTISVVIMNIIIQLMSIVRVTTLPVVYHKKIIRIVKYITQAVASNNEAFVMTSCRMLLVLHTFVDQTFWGRSLAKELPTLQLLLSNAHSTLIADSVMSLVVSFQKAALNTSHITKSPSPSPRSPIITESFWSNDVSTMTSSSIIDINYNSAFDNSFQDFENQWFLDFDHDLPDLKTDVFLNHNRVLYGQVLAHGTVHSNTINDIQFSNDGSVFASYSHKTNMGIRLARANSHLEKIHDFTLSCSGFCFGRNNVLYNLSGSSYSVLDYSSLSKIHESDASNIISCIHTANDSVWMGVQNNLLQTDMRCRNDMVIQTGTLSPIISIDSCGSNILTRHINGELRFFDNRRMQVMKSTVVPRLLWAKFSDGSSVYLGLPSGIGSLKMDNISTSGTCSINTYGMCDAPTLMYSSPNNRKSIFTGSTTGRFSLLTMDDSKLRKQQIESSVRIKGNATCVAGLKL